MKQATQFSFPPLTAADEEELLKTARAAVGFAVAGGPWPSTSAEAFQSPAMAFVTLTRAGELRGCIGNLEGRLPLAEVVAECAVAAATRDPRFPPVTPAEIPGLEVSISLLGGFRRMTAPEDVQVGLHGLLIEKAGRRGLLLPQVGREMGLDRFEFLDLVCLKAGLEKGSWREGARVQIFTAREIPAKTR